MIHKIQLLSLFSPIYMLYKIIIVMIAKIGYKRLCIIAKLPRIKQFLQRYYN